MTGRDDTVEDLLSEKRFVFEFRMWSRSLRSSLAQMSCAAPPVGQRMIGTTPIVTTTEKSPETIRSTKLSSSWSDVWELFKVWYAPFMFRWNRSGSETTKFRYWS